MHPYDFFETLWRPDIIDQVFVAMPFEGFEDQWKEVFVPAIEGINLKPYRVNLPRIASDIRVDILNGLGSSRLVLADVSKEQSTGRANPNVTYELGIAHAVRHPSEVILVRQDSGPLQFDIFSIRAHTYSLNLAEARWQIEALLRSALTEIDSTRSLQVDRAISQMDSSAFAFLRRFEDPKRPFSLEYRFEGSNHHSLWSRHVEEGLVARGLAKVVPARGDTSVCLVLTPLGRAVVAKLKAMQAVYDVRLEDTAAGLDKDEIKPI
jgi:hypothetical protein